MADADGARDAHGSQHTLEIIKSHVNFTASADEDQAWRRYPEIPSARDLNPDWTSPEHEAEVYSLLPNTYEKAWADKNTYLETHYRLQREESISMLRYSIKKYREIPGMMDDDDTCVYTKVFVKGYLMTRLGPMCRIQFLTERSGKKIRWDQTRRLTTGSLVALSTATDGFRTTCIPAVIADHPIREGLDQNPPTIQIFWANIEDAILDPNLELVMLEARSGYFEAMRHSMLGLQHVAMTDTVLDKYLVEADKSDLSAQYVQENPVMDISSLIHHIPNAESMEKDAVLEELERVRANKTLYDVSDGFDDNLSPYTNLDNSQLSAVHRMLTKELAIIQGPPGTGKTYTSVQALGILLNSQTQTRGKNVILVAAQTNHAVDQILVQLVNLGFNVVRLGGRTQSEEIKRYSMFNLRQRAMPSFKPSADRDYRNAESARKRTIGSFENVINDVFPPELLSPTALFDAGLITKQQLCSLQIDDDTWSSVQQELGRPAGTMADWLADQLVEAPSLAYKEPIFDAVEDDPSIDDLEAEDYNLELDDCVVDEERGKVDGKWVPIRHVWGGANPQNYTEESLHLRREMRKPNLWDVPKQFRGAIYQIWQKKMLLLRSTRCQAALADYARSCKNLKINRWFKDTQYIRAAQVEIIGCTTTGLGKYRGLLAALEPRTMLIEEAAETREANIMSALYPSLQQLILVGDHQQLAPHCDLPGLALPPFYFQVSMFERLFKLQMPHTVLNMQRRMVPVLRELLNPFYPELRDHPVVTRPNARPPIPGMRMESYFFHHTWLEGVDENLSKFNVLEAEMVVRFIDYLTMNGIPPSQITVLTFYRGQRKKILSEARKGRSHDWFTNVQTVDSYQGEENDIVILSLVRSNGANGPHNAGFLRDKNRGVVAISRARRGFYIFGNMINLREACEETYEMWGTVENTLARQGRFGGGGGLPVTCQKHGRTVWITHPEDWIRYHGGCDLECSDTLPCGHACGRRCHWFDHKNLGCHEPCTRTIRCKHPCQRLCGDVCYCNCPEFLGAWPDDDTREDAEGTMPWVVDRRRAGAFTDQIRSGGPGGVPYRLASRRSGVEALTDRLQEANPPEWGEYQAQSDDARRRETSRLIDLESTAGAIRETYRPVKLGGMGGRSIVEGKLLEDSSTAPSPKKVGAAAWVSKFDGHDYVLDFQEGVEKILNADALAQAGRSTSPRATADQGEGQGDAPEWELVSTIKGGTEASDGYVDEEDLIAF
ncbi:P-loop containing nucleoside triphosphate hydrolase protein [Xylariomycetidae sp. FL0641]|nr:P-loop containing nucleoside triphosphate hydrolase protein [Xylariomycetidae sp. FL0641]